MRAPSGPDPLRAIAVTRDAGLLDALQRDGRVDVIAHLVDAGLAKSLAETARADAVFVDEEQAEAFEGDQGEGGAEGRPTYAVYVLRTLPTWAPGAAPVPVGAPGERLTRPGVADRPLRPAAERAVAPGGVDRPATLREWWLRSRAPPGGTPSSGSPPRAEQPEAAARGRGALGRVSHGLESGPVASGGPEVLMRQVIAVVSPKGGVGKTFVSVNLAASLARHTGFRVMLLDLDLHSGDAAVHLDLLGRPTLVELLPYADALESAHLDRAVTVHPPSHLEVLLAPTKPEAAEMLTGGHLEALLKVCRRRYDFVVIDTSPDPSHPLVVACLQEATAIVLVCSLDAAALRQCRRFLDSLDRPGDDLRRRLVLVLNQVHEGGPLPSARAATFLEAGLEGGRTFTIPEDRAGVERAVFEGRPLVLADTGNPVSRAIFELAHSFCPVFGSLAGDGRQRRGRLGRIIDVMRKW